MESFMKPKWLIERDVFNEDVSSLIEEIYYQGFECTYLKNVKLGSDDWLSDLSRYHNDDCIIFYGSLNLAREIQKVKPWIPGTWCNFKNFFCSKYYTYFGKYLFNQNYIMMPMKEAIRRKNQLYSYFETNNLFIRPDSGAKSFTGHVIDINQLTEEELGYGFYHEDESILVVISDKKNIEKEWRFVIADKKVISGSSYKEIYDNELEVSINEEPLMWFGDNFNAWVFADKIAKNKWEPDRLYTIDICKSNNKFYLLEINSFSCSDFYNANMEPIVREASRLALQEWKEYDET